MKCRCVLLFVSLLAAVKSLAAPFQNLDFEQANTNSLTYLSDYRITLGPINDLLPGWEVIVSSPYSPPYYTNNLKEITFDSYWFDSPNVVLTDHDSSDSLPRTGKYSLSIEPTGGTITLIQRGDVPIDAQGFRVFGVASGFGGFGYDYGDLFVGLGAEVTMNGIPLQRTFSSRGLDVSPFLGQNVELKIVYPQGNFFFREDAFSFYEVPEPSSAGLWILGFFVFVLISPGKKAGSGS